MVKLKKEHENTTVTKNIQGVGRITLNMNEVDPQTWSKVKEFADMFENVEEAKTENVGKVADNWEDFTLAELRERFPEIKATSKKAFIEQIEA